MYKPQNSEPTLSFQVNSLVSEVNPIVFGNFKDIDDYFTNTSNKYGTFDSRDFRKHWKQLAVMLFVGNIRDRVHFKYFLKKNSYCVASQRSSSVPGAPPSVGDVQLIESSFLLFRSYGVFFTR